MMDSLISTPEAEKDKCGKENEAGCEKLETGKIPPPYEPVITADQRQKGRYND